MARLLTADEVAEQLRMSTDWLYRQVRNGRFPTVRMGARDVRFRQRDVDDWINENTTTTRGGR